MTSKTDIEETETELKTDIARRSVHDHLSARRQLWALPLLTVSWTLLLVILVSSLWRIQRWETAPGSAQEVASRIAFEQEDKTAAPTRYPAKNKIRFVTAFTGQLSALDSVIGWLDPHVAVETYTEHFGERSPTSIRQIGVQSMLGAKQFAEYVAFKKLGLAATFVEGAVVVSELVCETSPAKTSACKVLKVGDTITQFDGVPVATVSALKEEMKNRAAGDKVVVTVESPDSPEDQSRTLTLIANPDKPGTAIIGFVPADTRTVNLPFDVQISTSDIGGPSAGLAFTLALLDELTPGELMGPVRVAATGTMNEKGEVGAIGALEQKALAARDGGARVFLVPTGQSEAEILKARAATGSRVKIIPVATLDDALTKLRSLGGAPLMPTT
ncbi:MAG: PDZ domain-containing protein [Ilumatobacteraceae bacterium]|nr:PDZ domain-containing protein [Ilumatobacteraceae bacterium]